jgi:ADP-dependent NAD(P)H-hydrate dehydratase / NAD(P)H-hydrate epimerase
VLPVLTAAEMRELDARAIGILGIPGPRLMEAAGTGAARIIAARWRPLRGRSVVVLCGKGNNGGDGFVVARRLRAAGARVRVLLLAHRPEVRGDAAAALARWRGPVDEVTSAAALATVERALAGADLVVDALLGTGLEGPARGLVGEVIARLERRGPPAPVISLDLPSGLSADRGALLGPTVRATLTTTFAGYKRSLLLQPAAERAGEIVVVPIGIPPAEVARDVRTFLLEESDARAGFAPRPADAHKGVYGHLLVVAGSRGKSGAAALAARAALRSGAGLVTAATTASQQPVVAALGMEHMTEALEEIPPGSLARAAKGRVLELAAAMDAVALGPGISLAEETQALARDLVAAVARPMVVDADALTALAGHLDILKGAAGPRLLTPHPGEMARMLGVTIGEVQADRLDRARDFAVTFGAWVALKGAGTVVAAPDGRAWINPTGNPGMAKGGSGDVLTGMAGAFLARGLAPLAALQAAVYLHGLAGDIARDARGEEGMLAGDIVEAIPRALSPIRA